MLDHVMTICETEEQFKKLDEIVEKLTKKHKKKKKINLQDAEIQDQITNLIKQHYKAPSSEPVVTEVC